MKTQQFVWTATWVLSSENQVTERNQLFAAKDLRTARLKAEKFQQQYSFDGELTSIQRRGDVVL